MKILRYIKTVIIVGPVILYYHFFYMIRFARHPEKYPFDYRFSKVKNLINLVLKHMHVDCNYESIEKFNEYDGKCMVVSNHLSLIDPLILIAKTKKPITFISKKEVLKMPFVGKIAKAINVFPIDRNNIMNQISDIRSIVTLLKDPNLPSLVVYIEGTRNKHPENTCLQFHSGTIKIAEMANVPVLTAATFGTFRVLDPKSYTKRVPVSLSIINIYNQEFLASKNTTDLADLFQKEINNRVDLLRKYDLDCFDQMKLSKKRKALETICDNRIKS